MIFILKVIVDFHDNFSNVSDSECDSDNEFDLYSMPLFIHCIVL